MTHVDSEEEVGASEVSGERESREGWKWVWMGTGVR